MHLCEKCLSIDFKPLTPIIAPVATTIAGNEVTVFPGDDFYIHSPTFSDLERSAAATGCGFCRIVAHNLKYYLGPIIPNYDADGLWRPENEDSVGVLLRMSPGRNSFLAWCGGRRLEFGRVSIPRAFVPFTDKAAPDELDTTTGSSACLALVKSWLSDCIGRHGGGCLSYARSGHQTLPTRLIDIGPPGQERVRLVDGAGREGAYIALSHCWGKSHIVTTTAANIAQHQQQGIPIESLPLNFRDAIVVSRAVGCRYLWIDSLCIIQDSREDWEVESGTMHLVYRNAVLTISVVRSLNPHTGCFISRDPSLLRPISLIVPRLPEWEDTSDEDTDYVESDDSVEDNDDAMDIDEDDTHIFWQLKRESPPDGPLQHRAWVMQEQAFSGRTVSFSEQGVFWSCASAAQSECTPYRGRRRPAFQLGVYHQFQEQIVNSEAQPVSSRLRGSAQRQRKLYNAWYSIISNYSQRDLTFDADRLQAIASLAGETSRILDDQYLAGIWRRDLMRGLLWLAQTRHGDDRQYRRVRPPLLYIAPSWSWASVLGDKLYFEALSLNRGTVNSGDSILVPGLGAVPEDDWEQLPEPGNDDPQVLEIRCTPAGRNDFGQVRNGLLRMEGHLKRTILQLPDGLHDSITRERVGSISWDEAQPPSSLHGRALRCLFMARQRRSHLVSSRTLYGVDTQFVEKTETVTLCLVLVSTGLGPGQCRRLGVGWLSNDGDWDDVEREEVEIV